MKKYLFLIVIVFLLSSCADVANIDACKTPDPYGFWFGSWHGSICVFSFIGSLFSDDIAVYAVNNTGGWYVFGFLLGCGAFTKTVTSSRK
jgi:hypothetical protein